jgi:hypothetical protein
VLPWIQVFPCDNNKRRVHKTKEVTFTNLRVILKSGSNPETEALNPCRETPTGSTLAHKEFSRGAQPSPNYFSALAGMSASARAKQSVTQNSHTTFTESCCVCACVGNAVNNAASLRPKLLNTCNSQDGF